MIFKFIFYILIFSQVIFNAIAIEIYQYKDAIDISRETNKKIYILFVKDNCSWCDNQKEILNDPEVIKILKENYIVTYVDISQEQELSTKYKIRFVPTGIIADENEKVEKKITRYQNKKEFIKWLD